MILNDIDLISISNIQNITVQTSQKISSSNLYNFITSSLQLNDISLNKHDKVFYKYINESCIYEIYILNSKHSNISTEANIYSSICKEKYTLFITDCHFIVYKNKELYFFKENKNYEQNDIIDFIKYKYKIDITNTYNINLDLSKKYIQEHIKSKKLKAIKFISMKKSKSFYYYLIYIMLLSVFVFYTYFNNTKEEIKINKIIYEYNKSKLNSIIKNINKYNLEVEKILYKNKYTLFIHSKSKNNIFLFLSKYKKHIKIKSLHKHKKNYVLKLDIEL